MNSFNQVIEWLVVASVAIGIITTYLTINKIWTRKSDPRVAESVSVFAAILGIVATLPFFIKYGFIDAEYKGAVKALVSIGTGVVFLLIGSGFWVVSSKAKKSFWLKFKKALKLETNEAGNLVKAILRPKGANLMLSILLQLAKIDRRVDREEFLFIETFAKTWNIPFTENDIAMQVQRDENEDLVADYELLQQTVEKYLKLSPPFKQSLHLRDVLHALADADQNTSAEEQFILTEIDAMLENYAQKGTYSKKYLVLIAIQDDEQKALLNSLFSDIQLSQYCGGKGYLVGQYYSQEFARLMCKKYRKINLFTVVEIIQNNAKKQ